MYIDKTKKNAKHTEARIHTDISPPPLRTQRASMQTGINQSSSQADEVYFPLKEWLTMCNSGGH